MAPFIVISGGIGSGKSTLSQMFHDQFGHPLIQTDHIAREIRQRPETKQWLIHAFGSQILTDDEIDVAKLRKWIFSMPTAQQIFNEYIQPKIVDDVFLKLENMNIDTSSNFAIVEIPMVRGMHSRCYDVLSQAEMILAVFAPPCLQRQRVKSRNPNLSFADVTQIIDQQFDQSDYHNMKTLTGAKYQIHGVHNDEDSSLLDLKNTAYEFNELVLKQIANQYKND